MSAILRFVLPGVNYCHHRPRKDAITPDRRRRGPDHACCLFRLSTYLSSVIEMGWRCIRLNQQNQQQSPSATFRHHRNPLTVQITPNQFSCDEGVRGTVTPKGNPVAG
uniref:Secreted protein n=1 Tax=Panagrellus redivivus TaxID=6233 RepID=A0A7E4V3T0_PANRE